MMRRTYVFLAILVLAAGTGAGCTTDNFVEGDAGGGTDGLVIDDSGNAVWPEASVFKCTPGKDTDNDGIPDEIEGCGKNAPDTDGDQVPDYSDTDSDGDKVLDKVEGSKDSDGDKKPDYKDSDKDNDGVKDGDEDLNGDGLLGCCLNTCGEKRKNCPTVKPNECGKGQKCAGGKCTPLVHFLCSNGESDPKKKITFPGNTPDKDLPTFVCHKKGETGSSGLKPMQFKKNKTGDWALALETSAMYGELTIAGAKAKEAAGAIELNKKTVATQPVPGVAGFVVSMPAWGKDVINMAAQVASKISSQLPGKSKVSQIVSGSKITSHDGFPTVVGTTLEVTLTGNRNPPSVRNDLYGIILNRAKGQLGKLPAANFGPPTKSHYIVFQTLYRPKLGQVLVMGGVAAKSMVADQKINAGIHLDDISNGTGLATYSDGDTIECDPFILAGTPVADIIWVVDESGSMSDNRQDIINNASAFFAQALKSGLNFRMGVAGMKNPNSTYGGPVAVGRFCSVATTSTSHDGGPDRFLTSKEQSIFKACVKNPPYYEGGSEYGLAHTYEAVTRHLPRHPGIANKIRKDATLVIIIATDEAPQEFKSYSTYKGKSGFLNYNEYAIDQCTTSKMGQINNYLDSWVKLFTGKDPKWGSEGKAVVHLIAGVCKSKCGSYPPEFPWGYQELVKATGGQIGDICQKNLGVTLQKMINSITGKASPAILQYVPMSASLAVAVNKTQVPRSRSAGFDYDRASNALIFHGVSLSKGKQVVASYRRWTKQQVID